MSKNNKKILMFGDSFIRFFTLYKSNNIKIYSFSGKTMKGISKQGDNDKKKMLNIINRNKDTDFIFFNFGQVDLHLSYYFKTYYKNETFDYEDIVIKYVKFINSIKTNSDKIIIDIYQSTLNNDYVIKSLYKYLDKKYVDKIVQNKKLQEDIKFNNRNKRFKKINKLLKKYCKIYNVKLISFNKLILNNNNKINKMFIDFDKKNIHIRWEPFIKMLDEKNIMKKYGFKSSYLKDLKESEKKYIKEKEDLLKKEK